MAQEPCWKSLLDEATIEPLHPLEHKVRGGLAKLVHDPAVGEEDDPVGVARGHRVVGHHHDGLPELVHGAAQELQHLQAGHRVEVAGRLIGKDHRGPAEQRPGTRNPLLLAAGELLRPVVEPVTQPHRVDDHVVPLQIGLATGYRQRQQDVLLRAQGRHQVQRLEDEPDPVTSQLGQRLVLQPAQLDVTEEDLT
jgi:hypothetical protein